MASILLALSGILAIVVWSVMVRSTDETSAENDHPKVTAKDVDDNEYRTVRIGTQIWMAENLRVTRQVDGTPVKSYEPNDDASTVAEYGRLYDWETACQVCPAGWHLPSDAEWAVLESYLGDHAAGKLKDIGYWQSPNTGATNETGFAARPAGYHNDAGFDNNFTARGVFWTSTPQDAHFVWSRVVSYDQANLRRAPQHRQYGFSVRCIRNDS